MSRPAPDRERMFERAGNEMILTGVHRPYECSSFGPAVRRLLNPRDLIVQDRRWPMRNHILAGFLSLLLLGGWCCPGQLALAADVSRAELERAEAEYLAAYRRYTSLVTTGGAGNVEEALRAYRESHQRYKRLLEKAGLKPRQASDESGRVGEEQKTDITRHPPPQRSAPGTVSEPNLVEPEPSEWNDLGRSFIRPPDQTDLRYDSGGVEVGVTYDSTDKEKSVKPTELTIKLEPSVIGVSPEVSMPVKSLSPGTDRKRIDPTGKLGLVVEGPYGEIKAGIQVDLDKSREDFYTEDVERHKEGAGTFVDDILSKFDFYYGGALGSTVGVESSWSVRESWTRYANRPAAEALENQQKELANQANWRYSKIAEEASRLGIDPEGKSANELIAEIHGKWRENPATRRPVFNPDHSLTILDVLEPKRVVTHGRHVVRVSDNEIVTTDIVLVFWNVGELAPGYGEVIMSTRSVSSKGWQNDDEVWGKFSGGPNGKIRIADTELSLEDGKTINHDGVSLVVRDSAAFAHWPNIGFTSGRLQSGPGVPNADAQGAEPNVEVKPSHDNFSAPGLMLVPTAPEVEVVPMPIPEEPKR